jgi:hypothetical protein
MGCNRRFGGVVTLSQIERNSPTTANAETRDFKDLVYWSIAEIRLIALNVTTPVQTSCGPFRQKIAEIGTGRFHFDKRVIALYRSY